MRNAVWGLCLASVLCAGMADGESQRGPVEWAQVRLDYAREDKVSQLRQFCERLEGLARDAADDEVVSEFFVINQRFRNAERDNAVDAEMADRIAVLRAGFDRYYFEHYFAFYDLIFVGLEGEIFHSIRKASSLRGNLARDEDDVCPLSKCIASAPQTPEFVDFHQDEICTAPAAFFVEPMRVDGELRGWLVLHCSVNKINSIFAWTENLGQTGETFLVNEAGYMLTESNFKGDSTILEQKLDDRNIQAKFAEQEGHRTVTDYRGRRAVTSFEVVDFLDVRWLVVAKVDQDEIATDHYLRHHRYYGNQLLNELARRPVPAMHPEPPCKGGEALMVDMDEYHMARDGEILETFGVSTCTGLIAAQPSHFAYMAHITPRDRVYGQGDTNLLGQMLKRITTFDVYPSQRHDLQFVIVAPHDRSLLAIVDRLVEEGFFLSQINVLQNPAARSASIRYNYAAGELCVTWDAAAGSSGENSHRLKDAHNLGALMQACMDSSKTGTD